jgi:hypothetical protein
MTRAETLELSQEPANKTMNPRIHTKPHEHALNRR